MPNTCATCRWYAEGLCANYRRLCWTDSEKPEDACKRWEGVDEDEVAR